MIYIKKLFLTKDGQIVVGQWPNLPIILWFVFSLFAQIAGSAEVRELLSTIGVWFLFVWAYLEWRSGVNMFRKILGASVMLYLFARLIVILGAY